jgi:hypothetical protein
MVQLVRLTTNDDEARFDNLFNQAIEVKPKSKIALVNFSCEINTQEITINSSNNKITFQTAGTTPHDIFLTSGKYDKTTTDVLLTDIQTKLNEALSITSPTDHSKQWEVKLVDSRINIGTKKQYLANIPATDSQIIKKNLAGTTTYKRSGGTTGTNDSFFSLNNAFCKGAGIARITITSLGNVINDPQFIFGLTTTSINSSTTVVLDSSIYYGVKMENGVYNILDGSGVLNPTVYIPAVNDVITLEKSGPTLTIKRYNGANEDTLGAMNISSTLNLYPVGVCITSPSAATSKIILSDFTYSADPYYSSVSVGTDIENLGAYPSPSSGGIYGLTFGDIELAQYLGFNNFTYNSPNQISVYTFIADKQFKPSDLSESYIVELTNINLNSYNGATNQRQNILATIVNTRIENDRVSYIAPYPLYIDIDNSSPLLLKNIRARVLKEDGAPISILGFSQMTILISD